MDRQTPSARNSIILRAWRLHVKIPFFQLINEYILNHLFRSEIYSKSLPCVKTFSKIYIPVIWKLVNRSRLFRTNIEDRKKTFYNISPLDMIS